MMQRMLQASKMEHKNSKLSLSARKFSIIFYRYVLHEYMWLCRCLKLGILVFFSKQNPSTSQIMLRAFKLQDWTCKFFLFCFVVFWVFLNLLTWTTNWIDISFELISQTVLVLILIWTKKTITHWIWESEIFSEFCNMPTSINGRNGPSFIVF